MSTPYHAKYFAHELTKRCPADSLEKLAGTLIDAQVDLNPHQVDAALFAFKSPLSKGAILADEVGLGKTIEAGIVLSQKWAEGKRRILLIMPASLRKQWNRELAEKFFLPSLILETRSFKMAVKAGKPNPFDSSGEIIICSYQFAANRSEFLITVPWDLVILDEAHRVRNVYKKQNKTARKLRTYLRSTPKLLLTATPLQNSLMELYGLVSFIDEHAFGDERSFRAQYARPGEGSFDHLKRRLAPLCQRTLRRQVIEYIKYTNRVSVTVEFTPSEDEQALYDLVSDYLRRDNLQALPPSQRSLMTLVLRKLLASSTFAIAGALKSLRKKLQARLDDDAKLAEESLDLFSKDVDGIDILSDEWMDGQMVGSESADTARISDEQRKAIAAEIEDLKEFRSLAFGIRDNAKGKALLEGLKKGFDKLEDLGASQKAIIFTESRRTQEYLLELLEKTSHSGKIVLFNGSNTDPKSREVYAAWKERNLGTDKFTGSRTADMRSALVDYFSDEAEIMIATEAAAEGINLQFCSLVVNYDLPWNPQRIEQRIGRCHRYGQKHDVVVVNFLNKKNAADQRVYQLLDEKFKLFSGVFGVSDDVLGAIESGVDFEKRIVDIYQRCRTEDLIQKEFDFLRSELDTEIDEAMQKTRKTLLENFDAEVHDKLRVNLKEGNRYLDKYASMLWELTRFVLDDRAAFLPEEHAFLMGQNPFPEADGIQTGRYEMSKEVEHAHRYRIGHPLAQAVISEAIDSELPIAKLVFRYSDDPVQSAVLEPLVGQTGRMTLARLSIESAQPEDHLIWAAAADGGAPLTDEQCQRLFNLAGDKELASLRVGEGSVIEELLDEKQKRLVAEISERNATFFEQEMDKLENWAGDRKAALEFELRDLDREIGEQKRTARLTSKLEEKIEVQREVGRLEKLRSEKRRSLFEAEDAIEGDKDKLLEEAEMRLSQRTEMKELFSIYWSVV